MVSIAFMHYQDDSSIIHTFESSYVPSVGTYLWLGEKFYMVKEISAEFGYENVLVIVRVQLLATSIKSPVEIVAHAYKNQDVGL